MKGDFIIMKNTLRLLALAMVTVILCLALASCGGPNADPDKALKALKDNDIAAIKDDTLTPAALALVGIKNVDCVVSGTGKIDDEVEHVTIIYFEEAEDANDAWEKTQEYAEDKKDKDVEDSDWVCKKSGKMIYYGTKNGIKAAK